MQSPTEFVDKLRPAGGRRSGKRDFIVQVFLRQDGHISAEELADRIRHEDARLSRATVYRTLQWMVDAGIARRVDFGEGRFRFEHAYRHPRHFHLICKTCNQSFEFLSSDIEALVEEVATARHFAARQSVLQIFGTCQACQAGQTVSVSPTPTDAVFARDALRIAIATERSGLEFYTRAARMSRDPRGKKIFTKLAGEEEEHLGKLEARYRELVAEHPGIEAEPTFLFFKGAAQGLFAAGTEELKKGGGDRQALLVGIRCERGSHQFFKKYGERFEESEGKRIFLEFADEEKVHCDLLVREYPRAHVAPAPPDTRRPAPLRVIDLHLHTTASDGQLSPDVLVRTIAAAGIRTFAVTDHDTLAALPAAAEAARAAGLEAVPGIEITAVHAGRDVHVLGYFLDGTSGELAVFLDRQRVDRRRRLVVMLDKLESLGLAVDRAPLESRLNTGQAVGRPLIAAALIAAGHATNISDAFERFLGEGQVAFEPRVGATPAAVVSLIDRAGGIASLAHPAKIADDALVVDLIAAGLPAIEVYHPDHDAAAVERYRRLAEEHGLLVTGGSDFHGPETHRAAFLGRVGLPPDDYVRLREAARG